MKNPTTIPTVFAPLDFIVTLVMPSISESIIETWDNVVFDLAEKAKNKGLRGINEFLQSNGGGEDRYKYGTIVINQEILNRLLKGEIKTLKELQDLKDNEMIKSNYNRSLFIYTIFHHIKHLDNKNEDAVLIDSIFINQ